MRILFLNPIGALGGGERSLMDIFAILRQLQPSWELYLIAGAEGALLSESAALGVRVECLPMPEELLTVGDSGGGGFRQLRGALKAGLAARRYAVQIRSRIDALGPDLIHSNGIKFHVLTRMLGRIKQPIVWHIRDFIGSRRLMRYALRWASSAASLAIANSEATAADARTVLADVPVRAVLNCIDLERFSPGPRGGELLDELSGMPRADAGTLRVGLLASYARWKGQDLFLKAATRAIKELTDLSVRFYIVGGPIYKTTGSQFSAVELKSLATMNGIEGRVGLVPFQNNPVAVYSALDIVVHASTMPEPFGRTIAEGMACGRAVIVANAGGARELFSDGADAIGIVPGDATALTDAIVRLCRDPGLRERLGSQARRTAEQKFSAARFGTELMALYDEVLM